MTFAGAAVRRVRRMAAPAVAVAVLAFVIERLGTDPFITAAKSVDASAFLAAAAIALFTNICSAWRWTIVARGLGVRLSLPAGVAAYYRAVFLNLTLPGGVAGDVHRGVSHGRQVDDVGRALRAVVWERTAGQVVQVVLTIFVLLVLPSPVRSSMPIVAVAAAGVAVGIILVGRMQRRASASLFARIRNAVVMDIRDGMLRPNALPAIVLASVLAILGYAVTFLIAARTVGATAPIFRLLPLSLLALLGMVLPNVAGFGPREGVTAWAFAAAGLGAHRGAAAAVAYGVMLLAASLPGAILLVAGWGWRRRVSRRPAHSGVVFRPEGARDA